MSADRTLADLLAIMARLRDPENGCPWDLEQTFRTILRYTLEEAYEVAEAIDHDDMDALREELGDLLFQVVFHARLAEERGQFDFDDVVVTIRDKMIRRHPHVFTDSGPATEAEIRDNWERIKAAERAHKPAPGAGLLDGIARALPALVRAEKLQKRASGVGFDWDQIDGVFDKVTEELDEYRASLAESVPASERTHEVGDLLFACVNLARHMGVDAEQALRAANHRFEQRFAHIEAGLRQQGRRPDRTERAEMERLWQEAKTNQDRADDP
ncbi:nucleoside triphosphate pyrophosphohydrolase [Thioalkalicoccus limnaeus]|uniref:Nucleoside triphosphate pyrophosphohydrolase n=1 Tax=Thioalkalicoccus limnaeus TaxID=120681 RepID=A0ABV4B906_9GAMM